MESHGVHSGKVPPTPTPGMTHIPPDLGDLGMKALQYLPFILIGSIWALVQAKNLMRGDSSDRVQIKRREAEERKAANARRREDEKVLNVAKMVANNYTDGATEGRALRSSVGANGCGGPGLRRQVALR